MECEEQLELKQKELNHLVEEKKTRISEADSSHDHESSVKVNGETCLLPPNLHSQQDDSVKHDNLVENESVIEVENIGNEIIDTKEIIKEIREIKKQNRKTHWLLSALIVLSLTWQLTEVSLLLKLKQGITNPFKAIGKMFQGKRGRAEKNDPLSVASGLLNSSQSVSEKSNDPLSMASGLFTSSQSVSEKSIE